MNSVELTRKDRFAENIINMKHRFGNSSFDFVPETYHYPDDYQAFLTRFTQTKARIKKMKEEGDVFSEREDNLWIYKPSQSSQGKGIYIIQELSDISKDTDKGVICKYISNPLLVN